MALGSKGRESGDGLGELPDRLKLPLAFDASPMLDEVNRLPANSWTAHFVPQHYRGDWSVAPLRAPRDAVHPIMKITSPPGCDDWAETEYLEACPSIRAAIESFKCPLGAARLMRLGGNSQIHEHRDADLDAGMGVARLHIPLVSNPDVEFLVNGEAAHMAAGECWYLRLSDPHRVTNSGSAPRIHLVIDAQVDDWLAALLHAANAETN